MERKLLDMMNQLSISEYNPRMKYCDKFQICRIKKIGIMKDSLLMGQIANQMALELFFKIKEKRGKGKPMKTMVQRNRQLPVC